MKTTTNTTNAAFNKLEDVTPMMYYKIYQYLLETNQAFCFVDNDMFIFFAGKVVVSRADCVAALPKSAVEKLNKEHGA